MNLDKAVAERPRQRLAPTVEARRVLCCKQHKVGVRANSFLCLRHKQLAVRVQQPIERLQHLRGRQVELVQHHPVPVPHSLHQGALPEHQAPGLVPHVRPQVLLDVCVLVVVDPHKLAPCALGEEPHDARLACACRALQQHRVPPARHGPCDRCDVAPC